MAKAVRRRGQATKYREEIHIPWAESLARRGATNAEMAQAFGISENTFYTWQRKHKAFAHALRLSKSQCDAEIVDALYRRATGQSVRRVVKCRYAVDADGNETLTGREVTEETLPPDTKALVFWLINRCPDLWSDKPKQDDTDTAILKAAKELVQGVESAIS